MVPVVVSGFLPPQRGQMKSLGEELKGKEFCRWTALVASVPPAPSAHPYAAHTGKSAPPAP